jgi:hypothetical protein
MARVAVLDKKGLLIGSREVAKPKKADIECGDLPDNGKYFYRNGQFIPIGFGKGKPRVPAVDRDRAVYELIRAVADGRPVPQECLDWAAWYEEVIKA